ncbi:MAG: DUF1256 domain-containing protein [Christensenellales bacterium]
MKKLVFVCIGTTKVVGDSVGPKVGDMLKASGIDAFVYGCSGNQITSLNVGEYARMLSKRHKQDVVVVIDSTLGESKDIGKIKLTSNGIKPGGAFFSNRKRIGDIGVMAIVGDSKSDRMTELKTRDEKFIDRLSRKTFELVRQYKF